MNGRLSKTIKQFQINLTEVAAILEAWVDFPEEGLEFATIPEICKILETHCIEMQQLADTFQNGRIVHEGVGSVPHRRTECRQILLDECPAG